MAIAWILVVVVGQAVSSPAWPPFHAPHNAPPPLHHNPQPSASPPVPFTPQLDPIDKCLFTCDHCFKHPQALIACANECIIQGGEAAEMGKIWLQACPQFLMPIYFDYLPMELP